VGEKKNLMRKKEKGKNGSPHGEKIKKEKKLCTSEKGKDVHDRPSLSHLKEYKKRNKKGEGGSAILHLSFSQEKRNGGEGKKKKEKRRAAVLSKKENGRGERKRGREGCFSHARAALRENVFYVGTKYNIKKGSFSSGGKEKDLGKGKKGKILSIRDEGGRGIGLWVKRGGGVVIFSARRKGKKRAQKREGFSLRFRGGRTPRRLGRGEKKKEGYSPSIHRSWGEKKRSMRGK